MRQSIVLAYAMFGLLAALVIANHFVLITNSVTANAGLKRRLLPVFAFVPVLLILLLLLFIGAHWYLYMLLPAVAWAGAVSIRLIHFCPECGLPVYRLSGKAICPRCGKGADNPRD